MVNRLSVPTTVLRTLLSEKGVVPVKTIVLGRAKQKADAGKQQGAAALALIAKELSDAAWVKRPPTQFNIDGKPGNWIVLFKEGKYDNADIDKIILEAGKRHLRLIKQDALNKK